MPRAEEDTSPRGLPRGAEQQLDQAGMQSPSPDQPTFPVGPVKPIANQPQPPQELPKFVPPPDQPIDPNEGAVPQLGINLREGLFAPSDRPGETQLAPRPPSVQDTLQNALRRAPSGDIAQLLRNAQALRL